MPNSPALEPDFLRAFLAAFGLGLSLIVAIGAQNAFVLAQGLRREHHISVALICMSCDAVLILAGTFGLSALLQAHPLAMEITRWGGVLFLLVLITESIRVVVQDVAWSRGWSWGVVLPALMSLLIWPVVYLVLQRLRLQVRVE
mgnify:CR=1 FL=1